MAASNRPWRRYSTTIELLTALLADTWDILREPLLTSPDPTYRIEESRFNALEQATLHNISNFAQSFLKSTRQRRLLAHVDNRLNNPDHSDNNKPLPRTNYDNIRSALQAIDKFCQEIATDLIRNGMSERIPTLRTSLSEVASLAAGELASEKLRAQDKKADRRPDPDMKLEVDPAFYQPVSQLQQQDNDTRPGGHHEPLSAERNRPKTPPKRKRPRALLSPGFTTRMFKRPSCEDLSTAADNAQRHFKGEGVQREEKRDGKGTDELDPEGRARYFGAFSGIVHTLESESSAGRPPCENYLTTILLPSRVVRGRLDTFDDLKALPLGGKEWSCCWVLEKEMEPSGSDWGQLKQLPGAHIVRVLRADLGPYISGEHTYYEVAICDSYRHHLLSIGFQLEAVSIDPDMWIAHSNKEIREYGMRGAEHTVAKRAEEYLQCALKALESGFGPGLDKFYRRFAPSGLRITVEWIILMRRLLVLPPPIELYCIITNYEDGR
ncbi:hypothetical protein BN1723_003021 [Verticillium longisporum]|uniref:Uncharacterized protein n=1 Tax=Verticillium longisporum TaxID=100787 RepID=A0A0G4LMN2_VERLO|nr:hypothetical protein BN1723_003021 [Verticillium longisporum]